jgi:hypothetical protein
VPVSFPGIQNEEKKWCKRWITLTCSVFSLRGGG